MFELLPAQNLKQATQIELTVHPEIHLAHYLQGYDFGYLDHAVEVSRKSTDSLSHEQGEGMGVEDSWATCEHEEFDLP